MVVNNNGWRKIVEIYDNGKFNFITENELTVTAINGIDELNNMVFYTAVSAKTPHIQHFYENANCLSCSLLRDKLANNVPCDQASFTLSKDKSHFVAVCTGPTPAYTQVFDVKNYNLIADWEQNLAKREKLKAYKETKIRYLQVPVEGGFKALVRLYLPPQIDFENPANNAKKYPMLVQVYGGPNSVKVAGSFGIGYHSYLTTSAETIYCQIDGRGTGNKGLDMMYSINNRLGTYEMEDQIAVAK
jgi:dipeptidyl-peptidase-4